MKIDAKNPVVYLNRAKAQSNTGYFGRVLLRETRECIYATHGVPAW
jgi:hypothetical protein